MKSEVIERAANFSRFELDRYSRQSRLDGFGSPDIEAIELLTGSGRPLKNRLWFFDLENNISQYLHVSRADCRVGGDARRSCPGIKTQIFGDAMLGELPP